MSPVDPEPSLTELATRMRAGTVGSDGELLGRVRRMSLRYARARLARHGAEDLAQDVAQEVCMAVMAALPTYDDRGLPFEALVYGIASRKVADAQRFLMRRPTLVAETPEAQSAHPGPETIVVVRDEADRAMQLVRRLGTVQQEIITLRVAVGLTAEETGAALGMTPGAVRVAQHRALTALRAMVAAQGLDTGDGRGE